MPTTKPFWEQRQKYDLVPLLATAKKLVDESEFVSKTDATKLGCKSTADKVQAIFRKSVNDVSYIDIKTFPNKIQTYVNELIDWVQNSPRLIDNSPDGYDSKVKSIYSAIQVADKDIPLAVSTIGMYDRSIQKKNMNSIIVDSEYVGELEKRDEFFVKLMDKINKDDYILYKCITREHNLCVFTKSINASPNFKVELGDCFLIKATPKSHVISQYDSGAKQTKFNRVAFIKNYGQPA